MLLDSTELEHGITCVDTGYIRPGLAACYLLRQGEHIAIIDTGVNSSVEGLLRLIDDKGIGRDHVDYVIPTHVHLDHAGGAGCLMQELPNARLVIHPRGARHMIDPSRLIAGASAVYGEQNFKRIYGDILPVAAERVIEADDGFTINFHGRELLFLDTPGHARHHFCIWDQASQGMFSGDTFGISYRELRTENRLFAIATTTPVQFDPQALHSSMDRLLSFNPRFMYLTHFGCIDDIHDMAEQVHEDIDRYVELAKDMKNHHSEDFEVHLEEGIMEHLTGRMLDIKPDMDRQYIKNMLEMDCRLNAQGVAFWINSM